ncbi:MAG: hypothetical protein NTY45_13980 [Elusimicrobia bacterium]|nr:hypothetical protein [Elusimicrobiota bacterium]
MTRKLIAAAVFALFAANAYAAQKTDLSSMDFAQQVNVLSAAAKAAPAAVPAPAPARKIARTGRYVQVSGYVNLNGNGFISGPSGGFTSVPLSGWGTFRDSSGQVTSNNTYINQYASMWIYPNQYVFQTVYVNVYAQFTYKGKSVGSSNMTGSVSVSGFPSTNYVSLNGSGNLSGSIYVEDAE